MNNKEIAAALTELALQQERIKQALFPTEIDPAFKELFPPDNGIIYAHIQSIVSSVDGIGVKMHSKSDGLLIQLTSFSGDWIGEFFIPYGTRTRYVR